MSLEKHHLPMRAIDYLFGTPRACTRALQLLHQLLRRPTASFQSSAQLVCGSLQHTCMVGSRSVTVSKCWGLLTAAPSWLGLQCSSADSTVCWKTASTHCISIPRHHGRSPARMHSQRWTTGPHRPDVCRHPCITPPHPAATSGRHGQHSSWPGTQPAWCCRHLPAARGSAPSSAWGAGCAPLLRGRLHGVRGVHGRVHQQDGQVAEAQLPPQLPPRVRVRHLHRCRPALLGQGCRDRAALSAPVVHQAGAPPAMLRSSPCQITSLGGSAAAQRKLPVQP